jgi:hypothetical protein
MNITPEQLVVWKDDEVTQELYRLIKDMQDKLTQQLIAQAGANSSEDARISGMIQAYDDVLKVDLTGD